MKTTNRFHPPASTVLFTTLFFLLLPPFSRPGAAAPATGVSLNMNIDPRIPVGECYNFWSVKNIIHQDIFDAPLGRETFQRNHPHTRYVNCIRFIGGRSDGRNRWLLRVADDGRLITDFRGMIERLRMIQEWGYIPMIVLDNVPLALSEPLVMHKYGNTLPPKDYEAYHRYIKRVAEEMVHAFGRATVEKWRFRVMTEPDLNPGHWAATKEEYFKLYDYAVDAVTQVLPDADIGPGNILEPARHGKWGLDIIDHCATGKNHCTGRTGTRMCFFSFSWYGAINEPVSTLAGNIGMIRERLGKYKQFQDVPVEVAEFSVLYDENHNRYYCGDGTEWSASWLASVVAVAWDMNIARIHQWATTTALDTAPDALGFEEVSSLMPEGMRTPYSHVLSMLEAMAGGERLRVETQETTAAEAATEDLSTVGAVASRKGDNVLVLLFNHKPGREKASPRQVSLIMNHYNDGNEGADEGAWEISEWLIDAEHSGFTRALQDDCVEAGLKMASADAPASAANIAESFGLDGVRLWRRNLAKYEALSRLHAVRTAEPLASDRASGLKLTVTMPTHSVRFLRLKWMPAQNDG